MTPLPHEPDAFVLSHQGLVEVHRAIVSSLDAVMGASTLDLVVAHALASARFLLGHHDAESRVLFPGLRRLGQLRSTDVAFLDACDRDHRMLHELCERLAGAASAPHPSSSDVSTIAREIAASFRMHIVEEEAGLAPDQLRTMITLEGLSEIGRELESLRRGLPRA
jgi:hypothetical protein